MVLQVAAITAIVLERRFPVLKLPGTLLLWLVVVSALVSAAQYFWKFWRRLDAEVKGPLRPRMVVLPPTVEAGDETEIGHGARKESDVAAQR